MIIDQPKVTEFEILFQWKWTLKVPISIPLTSWIFSQALHPFSFALIYSINSVPCSSQGGDDGEMKPCSTKTGEFSEKCQFFDKRICLDEFDIHWHFSVKFIAGTQWNVEIWSKKLIYFAALAPGETKVRIIYRGICPFSPRHYACSLHQYVPLPPHVYCEPVRTGY